MADGSGWPRRYAEQPRCAPVTRLGCGMATGCARLTSVSLTDPRRAQAGWSTIFAHCRSVVTCGIGATSNPCARHATGRRPNDMDSLIEFLFCFTVSLPLTIVAMGAACQGEYIGGFDDIDLPIVELFDEEDEQEGNFQCPTEAEPRES